MVSIVTEQTKAKNLVQSLFSMSQCHRLLYTDYRLIPSIIHFGNHLDAFLFQFKDFRCYNYIHMNI